MAKTTRPGSRTSEIPTALRARTLRADEPGISQLRTRSPGGARSIDPAALRTVALRTAPGVVAYEGWKNISIGVWIGQATVPAVNAVLEMSMDMEREFPEGRSSVVFVLDQVAAPRPEAQPALARIYDIPGLACLAIVVEGTGFWASGIRSMSNNMHRSSGGGMRMRVHTGIEEVLMWLPEEHRARTGVHVQADELRHVLTTARIEAEARARSGG